MKRERAMLGAVIAAVLMTGGVCAAPIVNPCPEDIDGDGGVGVNDLVEVILNWGGGGGPADVTGDGFVNVDDLYTVIVAWGPCP